MPRITISDSKVLNIWTDPDGKEEAAVHPTFYADSGTPGCDENGDFSGDDMVYNHTEIEVDECFYSWRKVDGELLLQMDNELCKMEHKSVDDAKAATTAKEAEGHVLVRIMVENLGNPFKK